MRLENASRRAKFFLDRVPQRAGEFWRRFPRGWGQDREVDEGGHGWKEACQLPRSHPEVGRAQVGGEAVQLKRFTLDYLGAIFLFTPLEGGYPGRHLLRCPFAYIGLDAASCWSELAASMLRHCRRAGREHF